MMADHTHGAILIVTTQRDDRRVLFETLDGQDFDAVYTAKDLPQALAFLQQDPKIDVVVMEFHGEARDAAAFCATLKRDPKLGRVPVIGIAAADPAQRQWGWGKAPPGVVDWMRSPVEANEVLARVRGVLTRKTAAAPAATAPVPSPDTPATNDRYQFAFEGSLDEIVVSDPTNGRILEVNAAFEQRSGFRRTQVIGQPLDDLDQGNDRQQRAALLAGLAREGQVRFRSRKPRAGGGDYAVDVHMRSAVQQGKRVWVTVFREPAETARHQAALGLVAAAAECGGDEGLNQIVKLLCDWLSPDFVMLVASLPEEAGEAQPLVTYHRTELPADAPDPLKQPTLKRLLDGVAIIQGEKAWSSVEQDQFLTFFRFETFIGLPLRDERRNTLGAMLIARRKPLVADTLVVDTLRTLAARLAADLELRRAREQGRAQGLQDTLTGMPNRLLFNDRLETTIKEAHRTGEQFSVLFVDLDRFKSINDSLGHGIGDEVLIGVGKRLRGAVRASDTVARYAGDEFTMILRHIIQRDDVMRIAEKIVRVMEVPLTLSDGSELHITASIGVSFYPDDAASAERLLKHADVAMYSAKGMGRNNFQTYVAVPEESHQQRLALESKLRNAEKNGELRVYYQPQVETQSEDIAGMEALIRWEHPELGMISPAFFIPLAEENGLIIPIGEWVLRTACADARRWQTRFGMNLRVGVNLSALQLRQPTLVDLVAGVLRDTGLEADLLDLEVTESISVKSIPNLLETLQGLRDLGCHISIDDFGTGQSSLDYIKRFPADRIKVDQTFVRNIGVDPDDEAIVRATIGMAHNLNRAVVAEGVEIEEHLEFLRTEGCEELQGYLFCRPLPAASFENLLAERERIFLGAPTAEAAT
jgi:diguanylate cyclase (GGDEF)-like protein/PAS domain S-box-containing protein